MSEPSDSELLAAAKAGNGNAFEHLFHGHVPKLRGVLRRMVGHPEDVEDLTQQSLLKAYEGLEAFRGESSAGTWLCAIGARLAVDHLRSRKRWRERAQSIFADSCLKDETIGAEVGAVFVDPDFRYDVNEHIAYCFTCVGRTLEPETQAALVLRDVLGLSNDEAARALGFSTSVLRHHLAAARKQMQDTFEGLCALVNKQGICWQCSGLRQATPKDKAGPEVPEAISWDERLQLVRDVDLIKGKSKRLHDVFFRHTEVQEQERRGKDDTVTECGRPGGDQHAEGGAGAGEESSGE